MNTVGENIIATNKMQNNFCYPLKMVILSNRNIAILDFSLLLPSSYRSFNFAIAKVVARNLLSRSRESLKKRSNELIPKRMQRGVRVIPLQGAIKKSLILLSQYWKNEWLGGTIIISYFGGRNNIFADCICIIWWISREQRTFHMDNNSRMLNREFVPFSVFYLIEQKSMT